MKICIVGGSGNISTAIVTLLLQQGHEVTCYNRGQSGEIPAGARVIHGNRQARDEFEAAMQRERFDAAIDMICFTREDAASSLRAFRGVSHFVQCSTVCTYGTQADWLPVTEDHPLRPTTEYGRGKVAADNLFLEAHYADGFPVTILKPSTTFGPRLGLLRQVAWEFGWIDRVRKGKPILVCGDGIALHQFLNVQDAAPGFAGVLGKPHCIGQIYNLVKCEFISWAGYHQLAMKVLGREVELVGIPLHDLLARNIPGTDVCRDIFAHNAVYSGEKVMRDVPEFRPQLSLEAGFSQVLDSMDEHGLVPNSDDTTWEDEALAAQRSAHRK